MCRLNRAHPNQGNATAIRALGLEAGPADASVVPKTLSPATLRMRAPVVSPANSKAKRYRAERRHLLRRMTGSRHPERVVVGTRAGVCLLLSAIEKPPSRHSLRVRRRRGSSGAGAPRQLPGCWQGRKEGLHTSEHLRLWCAMAGSVAAQLQCALIRNKSGLERASQIGPGLC